MLSQKEEWSNNVRNAVCNENQRINCDFLCVSGGVGGYKADRDDIGSEVEVCHEKGSKATFQRIKWEGIEEDRWDHSHNQASEHEKAAALDPGIVFTNEKHTTITNVG